MRGLPSSLRWLASGLALLALATLVFAPLVALAGAWRPQPLDLARRLGSPLGLRTLAVAVVAAAVAAGLGTASAIALAGSARPWSWVLKATALFPLLVPPYLYAWAWTRLHGGPGGPLDSVLGCGFVLGAATSPLVALPAASALSALSGSSRDAARLHLSPPRRLALALGALRRPVAAGALVAGALAGANLAVPMVLRTDVYALEILSRFSAHDLSGALDATAVPLSIAGLGIALAFGLAGPSRPALRWRPATRAGSHLLGLAGLLLAGVLAVAPIAVLARDLRGLADIERALATAGDELFTGLLVSAATAGLVTTLAFCAAPSLVALGRLASPAAVALGLACAVPGACVGLGLQQWVNGGVIPLAVADGPALLVLAIAARTAPLALLIAWAAVAAREPRALEAARLAGLAPAQRLRWIDLPALAGALGATAALVFALSLSELDASVLVAPPGTSTLAVRLASLLHYGEDALVSALCVVTAGLAAAGLALSSLIAGRTLDAPP